MLGSEDIAFEQSHHCSVVHFPTRPASYGGEGCSQSVIAECSPVYRQTSCKRNRTKPVFILHQSGASTQHSPLKMLSRRYTEEALKAILRQKWLCRYSGTWMFSLQETLRYGRRVGTFIDIILTSAPKLCPANSSVATPKKEFLTGRRQTGSAPATEQQQRSVRRPSIDRPAHTLSRERSRPVSSYAWKNGEYLSFFP